MYEIPTLAIVNEVFFRMNYDYEKLYASFRERLADKLQKLVDGTYCLGNFSEFGLRRVSLQRHRNWQYRSWWVTIRIIRTPPALVPPMSIWQRNGT